MWNLSWIVAASLVVGCSSGEPTDQNPASAGLAAARDVPHPIPDAKPEGIRLGPIVLDEEVRPDSVGLCIDIHHPSPADVHMWLYYDEDNDGADEVRIPIELHLGRRGGWDKPEPYACPQELDGEIYYGGATSSLLSPLLGHGGGGTFTLVVSDSLEGDTGVVRGWWVRRWPASGTAL